MSPDDRPDSGELPRSGRARLAPVSQGRRVLGLVLAVVGPVLLTSVLLPLRDVISLSSVLLLYLSTTVAVAAIGGLAAGVVAAVITFGLGDFLFTEPYHTLAIADADVLVELCVFLAVAVTVSTLADVAARREAEATRARAEAAALARLSSTLLRAPDPLTRLVFDLKATFGLDAVAILRRGQEDWTVERSAGHPVARSPDRGSDALPIDADHTLVLAGRRLPADDRRLLAAFAAQLALAIERQRLSEEAGEARVLAQTNRLRAALLSAVSHDLRTPLATIKAWTTSLLATDVQFSADDTRAILGDVVAECDRLDDLVGNLLDMSRLQADAVAVNVMPIGIEEVIPGALAGHVGTTDAVKIDLADDLPEVLADPALLERVVANLVDNAMKWSDPPVRIEADEVGDRVHLRVIDGGPGIDAEQRDRVFEPFQRLGDAGADPSGVGLGLAVARGFADAMGASLSIDDTPGGGTTVVVNLRRAS